MNKDTGINSEHIESMGSVSSTYVPKTKEEIKDIAMGMREGRIFTSMQIREHDMNLLNVIFLPLVFMDYTQYKSIELMKIVHFYGHIDGGGSGRAINGYPSLFNMGMLNADDAKKVCDMYEKINAALEDL